jgi:hypothetical protein
MPEITSVDFGEFTADGCLRTDLPDFRVLHRNFRNGRDLNPRRRILCGWSGGKLVLLARSDDSVVGFEMSHFRAEEPRDVIHEAFIGVSEQRRGAGLSVAMRNSPVAHFSRVGLRAISSRSEESNGTSLKSALRAGYVVVCEEQGSDGGNTLRLERPLR